MPAAARRTSHEPLAAHRARDAFLSADTGRDPKTEQIDSWVRVSWERSRDAQVDVDHPRTPFIDDWEVDSTLTRAASGVLDAFAREIENEPVCVILTDAKGTVLERRGGDRELLAQLDRVDLAPGFTYAEPHVGTNGIGTALEVRGPVLINGGEHYSDALTHFSCAGALVTHPINGSLLGVVDLTTSADRSNALLLSFAKIAAQRIRERVLENADTLERALLDDYYATCRHSGRPVLAVGQDVLMMNALIHRHFDPHDQAALLAQIQEVRGSAKAHTVLLDLPSGATARLSYQPSFAGPALAGGVVLVNDQSARLYAVDTPPEVTVRGVAGDSPVWRQMAGSVLRACADRSWLVVKGEPGVGKATLVRAAHEQAHPGRRLRVYDAGDPETAETLPSMLETDLTTGADLVIRNAEALPPAVLEDVTALLQPAANADDPDGSWVAITVGEGATELFGLLQLFMRTVDVPPLRHHIEDLPALARHLLTQQNATGLTLSPAALNQLMRLSWHDNVDGLREVLTTVARRRRTGVAEVADLPPSCRSTTRRSLTRIESLERDAIVEALEVSGGDKGSAAVALGMSRATIYRKIRDYGLVR